MGKLRYGQARGEFRVTEFQQKPSRSRTDNTAVCGTESLGLRGRGGEWGRRLMMKRNALFLRLRQPGQKHSCLLTWLAARVEALSPRERHMNGILGHTRNMTILMGDNLETRQFPQLTAPQILIQAVPSRQISVLL